ncbi:GNAT family N-acetyltransferase [Pedobacter sp. Leaf250]|uniref:GNAT family N-acetyltransferase n=1 Tax=Pedobacter sp. Leaf250 TaxID=2876559 RepID=UPI001E40CE62|nr:GNAT family N-acetyltransferase [Pedobacter sp. Leaf250]
MQEPNIISATKNDYMVLIRLWEASVRATHHFLDDSDIIRYKQLILHKYFDQVDLYCFKKNDVLLGFLGLSGDNIQMLFIEPSARRQGIGKELMKFAIEQKQATKVDVNEQNEQALGFYKHLGFVIMERYENDDVGKPYPILSMELQARK